MAGFVTKEKKLCCKNYLRKSHFFLIVKERTKAPDLIDCNDEFELVIS